MPAVNFNPLVKPALFRARVANVFEPLTVMLSPEKVMLLNVFDPPANVLAVADVSLIVMVEVLAVTVRLVAVAVVHTVPVPLSVQVPVPMLIVLVLELEEEKLAMVMLAPLASKVPVVSVKVLVTVKTS